MAPRRAAHSLACSWIIHTARSRTSEEPQLGRGRAFCGRTRRPRGLSPVHPARRATGAPGSPDRGGPRGSPLLTDKATLRFAASRNAVVPLRRDYRLQ